MTPEPKICPILSSDDADRQFVLCADGFPSKSKIVCRAWIPTVYFCSKRDGCTILEKEGCWPETCSEWTPQVVLRPGYCKLIDKTPEF